MMVALKKKSKPSFAATNSGRKVRVKARWRRPKGVDNKRRIRKASSGRCPRVGYKNSSNIRGRHPSGLIEVLVRSPKELEQGDRLKGKIIRIASSLGRQKHEEIREKAKAAGIAVAN